MTTATASAGTDTDHDAAWSLEQRIRRSLSALTTPSAVVLNLLIISDHRSPAPRVYEVPISIELAGQLLEQVAESAGAAVQAELRPMQAGFTPGAHQWVHGPVPDGPLARLESSLARLTHRQYDRDADLGPRSLLALRVTANDGAELARIYQGFSPEKALARGKRILAFWNGEQFASLDAQPLVIDRTLRLFVLDGAMIMKSNNAYESLFGPIPDLREQAASTYTATFARLPINGGDELRAACESDINMMRKLLSIAARMQQPGYPDAIDMPSVMAFLERNPHIDVPVDTSGEAPALVFQAQAQRRWALLKLLDDDFLRSDLTNINYEANSKTEVPG